MDKIMKHKELCDHMHTVYKQKDADYGSSFAKIREKYKEDFPVILIRLEDKMSRLENLLVRTKQGALVENESIDDTLLDLACYCIMELVERKLEKPLPELHTKNKRTGITEK